jgi:hypothetical protein
MAEAAKQIPEADFDEVWYLEKNPDVAAAVKRGGWKSGYAHYERVGYEKGRLARTKGALVQTPAKVDQNTATANLAVASAQRQQAKPKMVAEEAPEANFDPVFYFDSYPLAREEMGSGLAGGPLEHYRTIGRYRGYLPNQNAPRPRNPAEWCSRFGGFWIDQPNARDLISAKLDLGVINERQADLLTSFVRDGYVVIKNAFPAEVLDRAEEDLNRAYSGKIPELQFNIQGFSRKMSWCEDAIKKPAKALDLHWVSPATRDLIFADGLLEFLHLVMDRRAFATQTLGFWRGSAQDAHQDSAYVNYSHPQQFLASWIALEDVWKDSGELFYFVGSHKLPEYLYLDAFKGVEEATRMKTGAKLDGEIKEHIHLLPMRAREHSLKRETFMAKRGDVLIWNADLAHGGSPISFEHSRKSVVTHYCTAEAVPSYFENRSGEKRMYRHNGAFYSSPHYAFEPKLWKPVNDSCVVARSADKGASY